MRCKRIDAGKCGRSKIKIRILEIKTDGKFYKSVKFRRSAKTKYPSAIQSSAPPQQTTTKSRFANFVLFWDYGLFGRERPLNLTYGDFRRGYRKM